MKSTRFAVMAVVAAVMALPSMAAADTTHEYRMKIAIDDGSEDGQFFINLDDSSEGFDMHSMQVGESQSIVDESGRAVLITRTPDGFELNVDGKVVQLPAFDGSALATTTLVGAQDMDFEFEADHDVVFVGGHAMADDNAITIISASAIDDATRDGIRSLLSAAGHDSDVMFLDGSSMSGAPGGRHATVIKRQVHVVSDESGSSQ